ncbi:MAG: TIGR03936 family radical SAM-associated protein [Bacillota bacterium]
MLIRTKFAKMKPVRYISHLEVMDTLRRSFRRAELPVAYSQGYNPHIQLSMGQPLSVGMTGYGEYFDLELEAGMAIKDYLNRVNRFLPAGFRLLKARQVPRGVKSLQAIADTAIFMIKMEIDNEFDQKYLKERFLDFKEIRIVRYRRNKEDRVLDLRPMIYDVSVLKPDYWRFIVSTGSRGNVRPTELIRALSGRFEAINEVPLINVSREGLFVKKGHEYLEPLSGRVVGGD